jgi:hypothetical protein
MKPFLHGKKCLEVSALRPPTATGADHVPAVGSQGGPLAASMSAPSSAHVEIVKEGGKVVRLIVTCGCGERVEIDCLYTAGN